MAAFVILGFAIGKGDWSPFAREFPWRRPSPWDCTEHN